MSDKLNLPAIYRPLEIYHPQINKEFYEKSNCSGYQVVRREYFSHSTEPTITFTDSHFLVNMVCLKSFPDIEYIQLLINPSEKKMIIRLCKEVKKDAFRWCTNKQKRKPLQIRSRVFMGKLFDLMDWDSKYRYLCVGKLISSSKEQVFIFDLTTPKIFNRKSSYRTPLHQINWKEQFGTLESLHNDTLHVKHFNNFSIFGIEITNPEERN